MCRNIKLLHHFEPPATRDEVQATALQYVRKLSGMNKPSKVNQAIFDATVQRITDITLQLFDALEASGPPRSREAEQAKAKARGQKRDEQMRAKFLQLDAAETKTLRSR